ncbi:selenocysteine insertion sequence-binding protein 2-like isoform X2 [Triplophysa dalaica]|uniref:selenocysteine insertion sequence-binding protein 2-like isoform X2 n=1 Tax=Triplophysa dalaica TaxID=1582913 RepID=UPI0024DF6E40|nr:selenocysteine insertion sequence-binding protein 2-like isoform X2 [Triplophysa dalaica]
MENIKRAPPKDQTCQSSAEDWFKRRQRSVEHDRAETKHGHSSVSQATTRTSDLRRKTGKLWKENRSEASSQDKRISRRSSDRKDPAHSVKSAISCSSTFEMKLVDFPELGDITPGDPALTSWPLESSACVSVMSEERQSLPAATCKNVANRRTKPARQVPSNRQNDVLLAVTTDQDNATSNPAGPASWANIASQPPKVIEKCPKPNTSSQEDLYAQPGEQKTEKKKRKKKRKTKTTSEDTKRQIPEEHLIQQEPPKIGDEEEFPDLSLALEVKGHSGAQKEGSSLQIKYKTAPASSDAKKTQVSQKKSKVPVQLDLGNMLAALEQKQQCQKSKQDQRPLTISVGGALHVVHKEPSVQKKPRQQEMMPHNPLDSTCPLVKKGKQREVPKAKKPTPLKRVILKEREERKQNRLLEERDPARLVTEAVEMETSENPSDTSLPDQDQHLTSDNPELVCIEEPESDQPISESNDTPDNDVVENPTLLSCNPESNPNLPKIHSRKFRDYCNQVLRKDVDECVTTLLKELVRFQDRLYQKDPMKARMKRRVVMGLREVLKHLKLRKVKCVIISPNCERIQSKGGLDEALHTIIDTCREQSIPFVFALSRKALGRCVNKAVPVSLVGIFNYDGAQDHYHKMIELSAEARKAYEVMIANLDTSSQEQLEEQLEVETSEEPSGTEEPDYIKVWKKMLEKDFEHSFLNFEEHFSSVSIGSEEHLRDQEGS